MNKFLTILVAFLLASSTWAKGNQELAPDYSFSAYSKSIANSIGKEELSKVENNISFICYTWYEIQAKREGGWTAEKWSYATKNGADFVNNKLARAAAASGILVEKIVKAIIVTTDKAAIYTQKWLQDGVTEYDRKNP